MAQLTWRNVDAPNFNGVTDALRLAGQSLTAGLSAGRDAITDFQKGQTAAESARVMAATANITDPTKLQEVLAGFDPRHVSPEAMKTALGRPQDLATLDQTKASTESTRVTTDFNKAYNPLRIQEANLINQGRVISNADAGVKLNKNVWEFDNTRKEKEAAPAYLADLARFRQLKSNPDPAAQAEAATLLPGLAQRAASAGVTDFTSVLDKGDTAAANGVKLKSDWLKYDKDQKAANLDNTSNELVKNLIDETGSPAGALGRVERDTQMDPLLRAEVIKKVTAARGSYATPSEAEILSNNAASAAAPQAQPQQAPAAIPTEPRARLDFFTSAAKAAGLEVTSAFRDANHPLTKANPNSAHAKARAWDLRARTTDEGDAVMAKQRAIFDKLGMQEGRDYKILDEVRKPAGHATGPHIHVQLTAEGEARQKTAEAGRAVPGEVRARQMISQAVGQGSITPAQAQPPANFQPGIRLETPTDLTANYQTMQTMLNSAANTSLMDSNLNPAAPVAAAFAKPPSTSTAFEVATQLAKKAGDKESSLFTNQLDPAKINSAVQKVVDDYKVTPEIAGVLIESAVKTTGWVYQGREVDHSKLKTYIDRFVTKDGKPKTELLNITAGKAAVESQITNAKALLEKAREEWLGAEGASKNGNTRVDVNAARQRFANAQRAADAIIRKISGNPNISGFSAANTGR